MSYFIHYQQIPEKRNNAEKKGRYRRPILTIAFMLLFFCLVNTYWHRGNEILSGILRPGDWAMVERAVAYVFSAVRNGQPFQEAVQGFCQEIIHETILAG